MKRDYCGNVLKAITEETIGFYSLPEDVQDEVMVKILEKKAKGKLKIWVTNDDRKMPVKMKSKIPVGSISAELSTYKS